MLSVKLGDIKDHFLSLWYNSTWDWTLISRTINEHFTHYKLKKILKRIRYSFVKNICPDSQKVLLTKLTVYIYTTVLYTVWACNSNNLKHWIGYIHTLLIGLVDRVFANDPGDLGSIPGRVIPKTLKMVLDTSLLNTRQYKVHIKGKVEQSRERSSALTLHLGVASIEKGAFWSPSTKVANFTLHTYIHTYGLIIA